MVFRPGFTIREILARAGNPACTWEDCISYESKNGRIIGELEVAPFKCYFDRFLLAIYLPPADYSVNNLGIITGEIHSFCDLTKLNLRGFGRGREGVYDPKQYGVVSFDYTE